MKNVATILLSSLLIVSCTAHRGKRKVPEYNQMVLSSGSNVMSMYKNRKRDYANAQNNYNSYNYGSADASMGTSTDKYFTNGAFNRNIADTEGNVVYRKPNTSVRKPISNVASSGQNPAIGAFSEDGIQRNQAQRNSAVSIVGANYENEPQELTSREEGRKLAQNGGNVPVAEGGDEAVVAANNQAAPKEPHHNTVENYDPSAPDSYLYNSVISKGSKVRKDQPASIPEMLTNFKTRKAINKEAVSVTPEKAPPVKLAATPRKAPIKLKSTPAAATAPKATTEKQKEEEGDFYGEEDLVAMNQISNFVDISNLNINESSNYARAKKLIIDKQNITSTENLRSAPVYKRDVMVDDEGKITEEGYTIKFLKTNDRGEADNLSRILSASLGIKMQTRQMDGQYVVITPVINGNSTRKIKGQMEKSGVSNLEINRIW